jgi:hypothetical protein
VYSENFKETSVQKEALILFGQGLLNYISGGWKGKIAFNEDKGRFEIKQPVLLEISSTPVPAKKDAKVKEILNSLNQAPIEMEDIGMSDEQQTQSQEPPAQGASEKENPKFSLLEAEVATVKATLKAQADKVEASEREALIAKGVTELGLTAEAFKGMSSQEIKSSLSVANMAVMAALKDKEPTIGLGAGAIKEKEGTPEAADAILKQYAPHLLNGLPDLNGGQ